MTAADTDHAVRRQAERKGAARWALPPCCDAHARPRSASAGVPSESARTVLDSWPYSDHALISTQTSQLCDDFHGRHEKLTPCLERIHRGPCLTSVSTYPHQPPATVTDRNPMFVNRLTRMLASGAVILGVGTIASLPATA